jgi:hypothetical protein
MLRAPSLQFDYTLVFSGDPALSLPDPATAPDDQRDAVTKERLRLLTVARETGAWGDITISGEQPTIFRMRSIHGELAWIQGESQRRRLTTPEVAELAFRCALKAIGNLGSTKVEHTPNADGIVLVAKSTVDYIKAFGIEYGQPALGHSVILELGLIALERAAEGIAPKR